jgi:hypothetical protein
VESDAKAAAVATIGPRTLRAAIATPAGWFVIRISAPDLKRQLDAIANDFCNS